jgi:hypothetical protein
MANGAIGLRDKAALILFQVDRDHPAVGFVDDDTPASVVADEGWLRTVAGKVELRAIL